MVKKKGKAAGKTGKVLSDHQQIGKRFVPPLQQIGPWEDANWMGVILPEILWIGLLNNYRGWAEGAELALSMARAAAQATGVHPNEFKKQFGKSPKHMFATTTAYTSLSAKQKLEVVDHLKRTNQLEVINSALAPLVSFYPNCSFQFLFEGACLTATAPSLEPFKTLFSRLFDRYDRPATFAMANAMYIAFCTNKMKVIVNDRQSRQESALANLPAIKDFPDTEKSRIVAAGIRASIGVLVTSANESREWPDYFWNRGLQLEDCDYKTIYQTYE